MPDGTVIRDVPDGITQSDLLRRYEKVFAAQTPEPTTDAGIFARTDFAASVPGGDPTQETPEERAVQRKQNMIQGQTRVDRVREFLKENAPAIGATIATLPFGGAGGAAVGASRLIPSIGRTVMNIAKQPARAAVNAGRAGIGGAVGGGLAAEEGQTIDEALQGFKEQASADTLARFALGAGKFLLKPAGKLGAEAMRLIEFARAEGLHLDPGLATERLAPKIVSSFIKGFFGSRSVSQKQLVKIGRHITSDPNDAQAFFKSIIGDVSGEQLARLNARNAATLEKLAGQTSNSTIKLAAKKGANEAADILFTDPIALLRAKQGLSSIEFEGLMTTHMNNMISRSAKPVGSAGVAIDGNLLRAEIAKFGEAIKRHVPNGREVLSRLEGLAAFAKAHAEVPLASTETFLTSQSAAQTGIIAGLGAAADPTTVGGLTIALSSALSLQMFNPRSKVGQWLTTGLFQGTEFKIAGAVINEQVRNLLGPSTGRIVDEVREFSP